jgi:hypothetical protein
MGSEQMFQLQFVDYTLDEGAAIPGTGKGFFL